MNEPKSSAIRLAELKTKLDFYKKLDKKIEKVMNDELTLNDWSEEVFCKIDALENEIDELEI